MSLPLDFKGVKVFCRHLDPDYGLVRRVDVRSQVIAGEDAAIPLVACGNRSGLDAHQINNDGVFGGLSGLEGVLPFDPEQDLAPRRPLGHGDVL